MYKIRGRSVLVTGGAGFLGSNIARLLLSEGAKVTLLDNCGPGYDKNIKDIIERVALISGDINDEDAVKKAVQGKEFVVHAAFPAAQCDRSLNNQFIATGTVGLFNILKEALEQQSLVIYVSSISVYGKQLYTPIDEKHPVDPTLVYGVTKLTGEFYCRVMAREYGLKTVILRYSDLYGPGLGRSNAPVAFIEKALSGLPLLVRGGGKQVRSYLFVTDAAQAVRLAIENPAALGKVFNVGGDETTTIMDLALKVKAITGSSSEIISEEGWVDEREYKIDSTLARSILGFGPAVDLDAGLRKTLAWLKGGRQA
jgi:nucleoside-diphosphate-sugar epimerase